MCIFAAAIGGLTATQALVANVAVGTALTSAIATPIYGYVAQQQAASTQSAYQNQMYAANQKIAEQSLLSQYADISLRQQQEQQKAAQEMRIISTQAEQARATARTSAMESGVAGLSVNSLMDDYYRREASALLTTQQQLRGSLFQLEQAKRGMGSEYQGRVLSMTPKPIPSPSLIATGLELGGNLSGMYSSLYLNTLDRQTLQTSLRI